ncbi:hypothetical protein IRJ41_011469 [Triplophysa rosa]|uniref:Uncharacterized protein n=1 Tax=Triplophysa rosa TaxID=992332 RepID=A0A9W7WUD1_TRIRA|nr:hypothetical protein IRJ41_011469 [Triplophysa rosa]
MKLLYWTFCYCMFSASGGPLTALQTGCINVRVVSEQLLILEGDKEYEPTAEGADLEDTDAFFLAHIYYLEPLLAKITGAISMHKAALSNKSRGMPGVSLAACGVYSSTLDDNLRCSDKQSKCSFSGNDCGQYPSLRWEPLLTPALS